MLGKCRLGATGTSVLSTKRKPRLRPACHAATKGDPAMDAARQETAPGTAVAAGDDVAGQIGRLRGEGSAIQQTIAGVGKASNGACSCAACAEAANQLARHAKQDAQAAIAD